MLWFIKNWKLIAIALVVAALIGERWRYGSQRYDEGQADEKATYQTAIAQATRNAEAQAAADRADRDRSEALQLNRIRDLQERNASLMQSQRPVRLHDNTRGCVPARTDAAPKPDAASAGRGPDMRTGDGPVPEQPDIGPALLQLATRCETDRQTVIAIQAFEERR